MNELFWRISEEKRNRILQASIYEFATLGYVNANTNKIARRAEISVGSLFQYFDNKEDLFLTTVNHCATILKTALEEIMAGEEDILIKVEKVLRAIQKHSRQNINIIRLYNEIASQSNSHVVGATVKEIEAVTAKLYAALIKKAQNDKIARSDCDPGMFAYLLDNIFVMLQFSYSCDYYLERFKLFAGDDILSRDDFVIEQSLKFIQAAFQPKS